MVTSLRKWVEYGGGQAWALLLIVTSGCAAHQPLAATHPFGTAWLGHSIASDNSEASPATAQLVGWQFSSPEEGDDRLGDPSEGAESTRTDSAADVLPDDSVLRAVERPPELHEASRWSVGTCVQIALNSHPKIGAARARVAAARNRVPQAKALPDPMLSNQFWPVQGNTLQTAGGRMQDQIGLSQQIPWPEKLQARAAIACREMQIAQAEVESIEREIEESVRLAYFEVWYAERGSEIIRQNQQWVTDLVRIAEALYRTGGSQQDVWNAEIEREQLQQQLLELSSQRSAAEAELAALLQQPPRWAIVTDEVLPADNLPSQLDQLFAQAAQCNPELHGLAFQIQRDIQKQRLAQLQRYPDLDLGAMYGFMSSDRALSPVADGNDMISFTVGVTLPVWRDKIRGGISEAAAVRASSSQLRKSEQLTIEGRLRRLLAEIDSLDQQRTLYVERIIPRSEQALDIATAEYTVGKTAFVQLTDNYRELLMIQLQVARIDASLAGRLAQLKRTVGCSDFN